MVEINEKDSTIKVTKACLRDTMVVIKVICKDPALVASTKIQLKRALIEPKPQPSEPSSDDNTDEENDGTRGSLTAPAPDSKAGATKDKDSEVTPAKGSFPPTVNLVSK